MIDDVGLKNLEKLHQLKTDGVISEADFEAAKAKLLAQAPTSNPKAAAGPATKFDGTLPDENDHLSWMLLPLRRYADFTGRSPRREFWMFLLLANLITAALSIVVIADTNTFGITGALGNLATGLFILGALAALVPYLAVQVRRFHDQGRSGWFALLNLIPYVGALVALGFMLVRGESGDNQYGPDPYA